MRKAFEHITGLSISGHDGGDGGAPASPTAGPLRADLVDRARALVPLLTRNAARTEADRRVPDDSIRAIQEAGLFRIMVPRRFGGSETDIRTSIAVARELALGCGSTAWVLSLINACAWITGIGTDRLQQDVWAGNPDARVAGAFAGEAESRRVDGGLVVSGRWPWSSGCQHADWGLVGVPIVDAAGAVVDRGLALIPMPELGIEDTWFVAGMKGTGSNTLVARDVTVPGHRILPLSRLLAGDHPTPHKGEALYRTAFVPVAALILIGPQLGLATSALEFVMEKAGRRGIAYTSYDTQAAAPTVQLAIARAAMLVETAHLHADRAAADIDAAARAGRTLGLVERARIRMETGYIAETAREAIRILCSAHGASAFAETSPLQRIWRDSEVASRHAMVNPEINSEIYGRALLGADPITNLV